MAASGNKGKIKIEYSGAKPRKLAPYKDDVLYSPEGQWKYPGQIVKVPSGDITMKGVNQKLLGVDDQGNTQMMYPGADYTFPGDNVTEYPIKQQGGTTPNPKTEKAYQTWRSKLPKNLQYEGDYDLRGLYESDST